MNIVRDKGTTINHDFVKDHEYEVIVRAVGPDGTEQPMDEAARNTITIRGKVDAPTAASGLTATGFLSAIMVAWINPLNYDFGHVEVWRANTDSVAFASKIADVKGASYLDTVGAAGLTYYYWVRAVNTSGVGAGYFPTTMEGVSGTSLGVEVTDIDDFTITATKMFTKAIVLTADVWADNSPAGSVAWNAHNVVYNGASYPITAGNTALAYVYWTIGAATYTGSATHPTLGNTAFMIAINTSGIHTLVWNSSANMVIGTAFIANLAVTDAKINTLSASKLTAGTIDAAIITVSNLTVGTNVSIGTAEDAAGVTTIVGNTIDTDYVNALAITVLGAVTAGSLTGLTIQTAAGAGKRVVISGADNNILVYNSSNEAEVRIDDTLWVANKPGIEIKADNGVIYISDRTTGNIFTQIDPGLVYARKTSASSAIAGYVIANLASGYAVINAKFGAANTGYLFKGEQGATRKFSVDESGNIYCTGTVDTVDVLNHAHTGGAGGAAIAATSLSGTLAVGHGGTGSTSFTSDRAIVSNAAGTALVIHSATTTELNALHSGTGDDFYETRFQTGPSGDTQFSYRLASVSSGVIQSYGAWGGWHAIHVLSENVE